jgi:hypothetical protein
MFVVASGYSRPPRWKGRCGVRTHLTEGLPSSVKGCLLSNLGSHLVGSLPSNGERRALGRFAGNAYSFVDRRTDSAGSDALGDILGLLARSIWGDLAGSLTCGLAGDLRSHLAGDILRRLTSDLGAV